VWVMHRPGKCYGTLTVCLPWYVLQLFKITLHKEDVAAVESLLAQALTSTPEDSGNLDPISKFVHVRKAPTAVSIHVFQVGNIVG
jgi:hypothetical protein